MNTESVTEESPESVTEENKESVTEGEENTDSDTDEDMTKSDLESDFELTGDNADLSDSSDDYKDFMPDVSELKNSSSPGNDR